MMYDELIKNLRHDSASALQNCEFDFVHAWMLEAADAIEGLQKQLQKSEVDNINLTGWLAEEHAKLDKAEIENIKLKEEFAKYRAKHRWIPVTERLPDIHQKAICFCKDGMMVGTYSKYGWMFPCYFGKVTHWMPIPEPPEVK